jgi:flagellar hook-basal body complex protein FliE
MTGMGNGLGHIAGAIGGLHNGGNGKDTASPAAAPFAGMMRSMVEQTTALDQQATQAVTGVMNGQGGEIHDAMIATQKADMAFELALQVRNKAVAAYQQMMSMQF